MLVFLLLLCVTVAIVTAGGGNIPCKYTVGSDTYNLEALYNPADWAFKDPTAGATDTFYINFCSESSKPCSPPNGVCQDNGANPPVYYPCGDANNAQASALSDPNQEGLRLVYGNGQPCQGVPRRSAFTMICDSKASTPVFSGYLEQPSCIYNFNVTSCSACKKGCGGGGGGGGLSPGSIILIVVACLIPVYLVVGALVKWKVYGAEPASLDIIPNKDFWFDLPFLLKDGVAYTINKCSMGRFCNEYSQI